jgi:nicotinamide mononucleotide transporter
LTDKSLNLIPLTALAGLGLGWTMGQYTDAERLLFDAVRTLFSILATYMEITKVFEAWLFWVVLNIVTIWLYQDRSLDIYAALIGVYSMLSVWGFIRWRETYQAQLSAR